MRAIDLSSSALSAAQPGDILRDASVHGLHAKVSARGKGFFLYFRTKAGAERRPKLGDFPTMSVAAARIRARDMLLEIAAGGDPIAERKSERDAPTVGDAIAQCAVFDEKANGIPGHKGDLDGKRRGEWENGR